MVYGDKQTTKQVAYWENDPFVMYFYDCDTHISFGSVKIVVKHPTTYSVSVIPTYMTPISVTKSSSISYISPCNAPFGAMSTPSFMSAPLPSYTADVIGIEFDYYSNHTGYEGSVINICFNQTQPSAFDISAYQRGAIGTFKLNEESYFSTRLQSGKFGTIELSKPCYVWIRPIWQPTTPTKSYRMDKLQIVFEINAGSIVTSRTFRLNLGIFKINDTEYTDLMTGLYGINNLSITFYKGGSNSQIIKTLNISPEIREKTVKFLFQEIYISCNDYGTVFPASETFIYFDGDSPLRFNLSDNRNGSLNVTNREYRTTMSTLKSADITTTHELRITIAI